MEPASLERVAGRAPVGVPKLWEERALSQGRWRPRPQSGQQCPLPRVQPGSFSEIGWGPWGSLGLHLTLPSCESLTLQKAEEEHLPVFCIAVSLLLCLASWKQRGEVATLALMSGVLSLLCPWGVSECVCMRIGRCFLRRAGF